MNEKESTHTDEHVVLKITAKSTGVGNMGLHILRLISGDIEMNWTISQESFKPTSKLICRDHRRLVLASQEAVRTILAHLSEQSEES